MKKLLYIIPLLILFCLIFGYKYIPLSSEHRMLEEKVVNYAKSDSPYRYYGYYKEVFRTYNYSYRDLKIHSVSTDTNHGIHFMINEFGDTVHMIFVDYTNYPRREE